DEAVKDVEEEVVKTTEVATTSVFDKADAEAVDVVVEIVQEAVVDAIEEEPLTIDDSINIDEELSN
ncbi:hypothetical protein Dimus_013108, partial [Dionaea muscipula]